MTTTMDATIPAPAGDLDLGSPMPELPLPRRMDIDTEENVPACLQDPLPALAQVLPLLLYELAMGLPALPGVHAFCAWLRQPERRTIPLYLLMGGLPEAFRASREFPLEDTIADWVWQKQRSLVMDTVDETRFPAFARQLLAGGIKSFCAVPLTIANQRIGVFALASLEPDAFRNFDPGLILRGESPLSGTLEKSLDDGVLPRPDVHSRGSALSLAQATSTEEGFEGIIGRSAAIRELRSDIQVVAPTGSTALILGETGTGKELIARAIHNLSSRSNGPFIKVNCAAIPAGLIESELFGHERGSFTGAVGRRIGRFEMADGGTLFLDEIGDIPLELQPKLLRVLQEQEFERIGSTQTTRVNVRIVAATSRDLPRMVATREFRGDLYYRLNVFPLRVPALRDREGDIPLLVGYFADLYARRMNKTVTTVSAQAMASMLRYAWPGNVRELQNVIERAVILSRGPILHPPLEELRQESPLVAEPGQGGDIGQTTLRGAEREHILQALAATNWVLGGPKGAAARLGLARTTLIAKMQKLGISRAMA